MNISKISFSLLFGCSVLLSSCGSGTASASGDEKKEATADEEKVPETTIKTQSDALDAPYKKYLSLKEALYQNDAEKAKTNAGEMKTAVTGIDSKTIPAELTEKWNMFSKNIIDDLTKIENAKDIAEARVDFSTLSEVMVDAVKTIGLKKEKAFLQHCPMAKNAKGEEGADWLDKDKAVANPYFGAKDEMRGCGETKESYKFE